MDELLMNNEQNSDEEVSEFVQDHGEEEHAAYFDYEQVRSIVQDENGAQSAELGQVVQAGIRAAVSEAATSGDGGTSPQYVTLTDDQWHTVTGWAEKYEHVCAYQNTALLFTACLLAFLVGYTLISGFVDRFRHA